jgi:hypothetical protein
MVRFVKWLWKIVIADPFAAVDEISREHRK